METTLSVIDLYLSKPFRRKLIFYANDNYQHLNLVWSKVDHGHIEMKSRIWYCLKSISLKYYLILCLGVPLPSGESVESSLTLVL